MTEERRMEMAIIKLALPANKKGSYIIEAAIIMPVIFIIFAAVIYQAVFEYQKAMLTRSAQQVSRIAAVLWNMEYKNPMNRDIYRLFSILPLSQEEEASASQKAVLSRMRSIMEKDISRLVIKPYESNCTVSHSRGFFSPDEIQVTIQLRYRTPLGAVRRFLGQTEYLQFKITQKTSIIEPAENIRNSDMIVEFGTRLAGELGLFDKLEVFQGKIKEKFNQAKDKLLGKFLMLK